MVTARPVLDRIARLDSLYSALPVTKLLNNDHGDIHVIEGLFGHVSGD